MIKVGLTGGIGSGKSAVASIFHVLGIPVFDADKQARAIMETDPELVNAIKLNFGDQAFINGKLNRPYLANVVFANTDRLEILNNLVHPAAIKAAKDWMTMQKSPYVIKEAALLFESGSAAGLDFVIGVHAPEPIRIQRVMQRDLVTREQVLSRMQRQIKEEIKMKLCDFVIVNDEEVMVIPQVLQLHDHFLHLATAST